MHRGQNLKIIKNFKYDKLLYDHQSKRLFFIRYGLINEIELPYLEQFWFENEHKVYSILKTNFIAELPPNVTDYIIFDNNLFYIQNLDVYRLPIGDGMYNRKFITKSNAKTFTYLLYKTKSPVGLGKFPWHYFLYMINVILICIAAYVLKILRSEHALRSKEMSEYFDDDMPVVMQSFLTQKHEPENESNAPY